MGNETPLRRGFLYSSKPWRKICVRLITQGPSKPEMIMALFDKLKEELDRAGKAAQGAFDEGKIRLEAFRTRQLADKAAQALGYAVVRAKQSGGDVDSDT